MRMPRRWPVVTVAYGATLVGARIWLDSQPVSHRRRILQASSTDVFHLERDPWRVIPESAVWAQHYLGLWLVAVAICLGALELHRGWLATAVTAASAHVVGTLVSEVLVGVRVAAGNLPDSARHLLDIGPSYVVVGCGAALLVTRGSSRVVRLAVVLALVPMAFTSAEGIVTIEVDAVGHTVAAAVGVVSGLLHNRRHATGRGELE